MPPPTEALFEAAPPRIETKTEIAAAAFPWRGFLLGVLAFAASAALYSALGRWHDTLPLPPGVDPILERLPRLNSDWLVSWGWIAPQPLLYWAWFKRDARRVPWQLWMIAFWVALRSVFVALNPVGPPAGMVPIYGGRPLLEFMRGRFIFDTELFFSGHTGMPFLYALLSRPGTVERRLCLLWSAAMGAGVLFTRNHFVIDVLGAYFMTYSIAALGRRLLKRWEAS